MEGDIVNIVSCPSCGGALTFTVDGPIRCVGCLSTYPQTDGSPLDLRLRDTKAYTYQFTLGRRLLPASGFDFAVLPAKPDPDVDFSSVAVPFHLSKELLSHFPKAKTRNSVMLDLGCGTTLHREACEHSGFKYVGLDYESNKASILGDAHALPFKDESFEFVLSIAVLEHIRYPFVMMKETYRVLRPGGVFLGTVAFLEPFHGDSYYHHTHLGTYNSLKEGGFDIAYVSPSRDWPGLVAQANMSLFPRLPRRLSKLMVMPLLGLHKLWWRVGRVVGAGPSESERLNRTTGAFYFVARKRTVA